MSNILSDHEMKKLIELGKDIKKGLSCDINGKGLPCRSDRLQVVKDMIKYLELHDYSVIGEKNYNPFTSIVTHINGKKIKK